MKSNKSRLQEISKLMEQRKKDTITPERKKQLMRFAAGGGVKTWREDERDFLAFLNANVPKALHERWKAIAKKQGGQFIAEEATKKHDDPFSFDAILANMDQVIDRMECAPMNEIEYAFIDGLGESPWLQKAIEIEDRKIKAEAAAGSIPARQRLMQHL